MRSTSVNSSGFYDSTSLGTEISQLAQQLNLSSKQYWHLRTGTNAVYVNNADGVVARVYGRGISSATIELQLSRIIDSIQRGAPLLGPMPHTGVHILASGRAVSFWPLGTEVDRLGVQEVADILSQCHNVALFDSLEEWTPSTLIAKIDLQILGLAGSSLPLDMQQALTHRANQTVEILSTSWKDLPSSHRRVLLHGEFDPTHIIDFNGKHVMADCDTLCTGHPEVDIAETLIYYRRMLVSPESCESLAKAYNYPLNKQFLAAICNAQEIYRCVWLASLISDRPKAEIELSHRLHTLDEPEIGWNDF